MMGEECRLIQRLRSDNDLLYMLRLVMSSSKMTVKMTVKITQAMTMAMMMTITKKMIKKMIKVMINEATTPR